MRRSTRKKNRGRGTLRDTITRLTAELDAEKKDLADTRKELASTKQELSKTHSRLIQLMLILITGGIRLSEEAHNFFNLRVDFSRLVQGRQQTNEYIL